MDTWSRRERMRGWISTRVKEGATFRALAARAGVSERTLRRWNKRIRHEVELRASPDREEHAFVDVVERAEPESARVEIVVPGKPRIVLDGPVLMEALVRVLTSIQSC